MCRRMLVGMVSLMLCVGCASGNLERAHSDSQVEPQGFAFEVPDRGGSAADASVAVQRDAAGSEAPVCGPDNCSGCCDAAGRCLAGTNDSLCGSQGVACADCDRGQCEANRCTACDPHCSGKLCGQTDGCGSACQAGSGCCTPDCSHKLCGESDGCGDTCQPGSFCCEPQCADKVCGDSNGCGGTCPAGSGCCEPNCKDAICGESDGCGATCAVGSGCCVPQCLGKACGAPNGCGGQCDVGDDPAGCAIVLENAAKGVYVPETYPITINNINWVAWSFEVPAGQQLQVAHVGFDGTDFTGGSAIAALVKLEGVLYDYPDSGDLSTPDVVAKKGFTVPAASSGPRTVRVPMSLTLQPGFYTVLFGTQESAPVAVVTHGNTRIDGLRAAFHFSVSRAHGIGMGKVPHILVEGVAKSK